MSTSCVQQLSAERPAFYDGKHRNLLSASDQERAECLGCRGFATPGASVIPTRTALPVFGNNACTSARAAT